MFKEITMLKLYCDRCGICADELQAWDVEEAYDYMFDEEGWKRIDGNHYCPNCWEYDNNDNIKVKRLN